MGRSIRFVLACAAWTVGAAMGTAVLLGIGSGFLFAEQASNGGAPTLDPALVGQVWAFGPLAAGAIALFLCAASRLPGTRGLRDNE